MVNRPQHIMILCLYALFSVFLGVVFITLSDSFYVGAGSFFAFLLAFICGHIAWFSTKIVAKLSMMNGMIQKLDVSKNTNQHDIQSVREIINNVTEIITTLISDNENLKENFHNAQEKNNANLADFYTKMSTLEKSLSGIDTKMSNIGGQLSKQTIKTLTNDKIFGNIEKKISDLKSHIATLEHKNTQLHHSVKGLSETTAGLSQMQKKYPVSPDFDETFIHHNHMNVRTVSPQKAIYDVSHSKETQKPISLDAFDDFDDFDNFADFDTIHKNIRHKENTQLPNNHTDDNDNDSDINFPEEYTFSDDFYDAKNASVQSLQPKPVLPLQRTSFKEEEDFLGTDEADDDFADLTLPKNIHITNKNISVKNAENDTDFTTIDQKTTEKYRHLLDESHDETFLETIDDYQAKTIREQLNQPTLQMPAFVEATPYPKSVQTPAQTPTMSLDSYSNSLDEDDDAFLDITTDFPEQKPEKIPEKIPEQAVEQKNVKQVSKIGTSPDVITKSESQPKKIPPLTELIPDEKLKHIAQRQAPLKSTIPSLDSILNKPSVENTPPISDDISLLEESFEASPNPKQNNHTQSDSDTKKKETKDNQFIKTIRTAIDNNNLDLFTCPITDNRVREVRFFENYNYLRDETGQYLSPSEFMPLARGQGMGIALDRLMITRSIQLFGYLSDTIKDAAIFCNISILSITDPNFEIELYDLLQAKNSICKHLIFEFPQQDLELLNSVRIEKMLHLNDMGIRFSVDNINSTLPNLSELSRIGIAFIKIRPLDFMNGLYCDHAVYKNKDIKRICHKAGILLCVSGVDDHENLLTAVENEADLLQGDLLGEKERSDHLETYAA